MPQVHAETISLFGFAPGGACPAMIVANHAVRSYRTFSPLPIIIGGIFSAALIPQITPEGVLWPNVIRHRFRMEPGLSSLAFRKTKARSPGRLIELICRKETIYSSMRFVKILSSHLALSPFNRCFSHRTYPLP